MEKILEQSALELNDNIILRISEMSRVIYLFLRRTKKEPDNGLQSLTVDVRMESQENLTADRLSVNTKSAKVVQLKNFLKRDIS